jgi:hypothetical protein
LALQAAELYADGLLDEEDLRQAHQQARAVLGGHYGEDVVGACADAAELECIPALVLERARNAAAGAAGIRGWDAARQAEEVAQAGVCRDLFSPFRAVVLDPAWLVVRLAQALYDSRDFRAMPVLGDALEEAGCCDAVILEHCRRPGEHYRGCVVVDALLGKT